MSFLEKIENLSNDNLMDALDDFRIRFLCPLQPNIKIFFNEIYCNYIYFDINYYDNNFESAVEIKKRNDKSIIQLRKYKLDILSCDVYFYDVGFIYYNITQTSHTIMYNYFEKHREKILQYTKYILKPVIINELWMK